MRSGTIIAIVAAIVVVVGAVVWNQSQQPALEEDMATQPIPDQDEDPALEEDTALPAEEPALPAATEPEDIAAGDETADTPPAGDVAADEAGAGTDADDPEVIGDEITEDAIVVESETDDAVILGADDTATSAEIVEDDTATGTATTPATGTDVAAAGGATADPEQLLTPANYDREEVLALIDESAEITEQQRTSLRALVQGADGSAETVDAAIGAVRDALDLPPLE